ncbi:MAG: AAA family ATPase [Candidatus Uhrbacteria bacterium]|nr:AAA family ATPase [Candidatus Uhrbacteria bacterium]
MRLVQLKVHNFRSIKELDLNISNATVLVGPNNAGKSAILDAIRLVLTRRWGQRGTGFTEYDVFLSDPKSDPRKTGPITVQMTVEETADDTWPDELATDLDRLIQVDVKTGLRSIILRVTYTWDDTSGTFEPNWEFLNVAEQPLASGRRIMNVHDFFNYFPAFHLGPLRDASDEFSPRSQFWGRLLKSMQIPDSIEVDVASTLETLNEKLLKADPRLKQIADTLNGLQSVSASDNPGGVNLRMLPFDTWDMLSRAEIIAQNETTTPWFPITRHGQGMQSLAVILLFKAFIQHALSEYYKPQATPILTLEEPEAHLHPQAARVLWKEIKNLPGQRVVATHSPYFIQQTSLRDIRWVKMDKDGTSVTYLPKSYSANIPWVDGLQTIIDGSSGLIEHNRAGGKLIVNGKLTEDVFRAIVACYGSHVDKAKILGHLRDLKERSRVYVDDATLNDLEGSARRIRGEILFARKWLLVEGQTEYFLVHAIAEAQGYSLDEKGISIVDFQNNGSPGLFAVVARALDIPWRMVCDGGAEVVQFSKQLKNLDFTAAEIIAHRSSHVSGSLEEQLLGDGMEPELRTIATELGLANASACKTEELKDFLCKNKVAYGKKLADHIVAHPDVIKRMPEEFKKAIKDLV